MDASDGAKHSGNGNGHKPTNPDPVSLPSAAVPPAGGPVEASQNWKSMAEESSGRPVKRDAAGRVIEGNLSKKTEWKKGHSGNPLGIQSYNAEIWKIAKKLKVTDQKGKVLPFLEALLLRGLQEKDVIIELLSKFMADPTPTATSGVTINNNGSAQAGASASNESNAELLAKLLSDSAGREDVARFTERLAACGAFSRDAGNVRN